MVWARDKHIVFIAVFILATFSWRAQGSENTLGDSSPVPMDGHPPSAQSTPRSLPRSFEREADKAAIFQEYARSVTELAILPRSSKQEIGFCQQFAEDLQAMRGIDFIEPIARGATMGDPKLRAHWPHCAALEPASEIFPVVPSLMRQRQYFKTKEADLYSVNILNETPSVERLVLFAHGLCTHDVPAKCIYPHYDIVDAGKCALRPGARGIDSYENLWGSKYGVSALVSYRNKIYSLTLDDQGEIQNISLFAESTGRRNTGCLLQRPLVQ